jgi:hypothetical protein
VREGLISDERSAICPKKLERKKREAVRKERERERNPQR